MRLRSVFTLGVVALALASAGEGRADVRFTTVAKSLGSTVTTETLIKGAKRRLNRNYALKGVLYDAGGRTGQMVEIARPDMGLIWEADPKARTYREVLSSQLIRELRLAAAPSTDPNKQPLRSVYSTNSTQIKLQYTGKQKRVAGLPCKEIEATVVIGVRNLYSNTQGRVLFTLTAWMTEDRELVRQVNAFDAAYAEAMGSTLSLAEAELLNSEWMDAFVPHIRAMQDRLRATGAFPMASTLIISWQAIAQTKREKSRTQTDTVVTTEVKSVQFDAIADSEFEVPRSYRRDFRDQTKPSIAATPQPTAPVGSRPAPATVARITPPAGTPTPTLLVAVGAKPLLPGEAAPAPRARTQFVRAPVDPLPEPPKPAVTPTAPTPPPTKVAKNDPPAAPPVATPTQATPPPTPAVQPPTPKVSPTPPAAKRDPVVAPPTAPTRVATVPRPVSPVLRPVAAPATVIGTPLPTNISMSSGRRKRSKKRNRKKNRKPQEVVLPAPGGFPGFSVVRTAVPPAPVVLEQTLDYTQPATGKRGRKRRGRR